MAEKKQNAIGVFVDSKRATDIYTLALQGFSIQQIADKLDVLEESVQRTVSQQNKIMTLRMQELQEQWSSIALARTEWLLSKIMPVMEEVDIKAGKLPSKDVVKMLLDVWKFQQTIVAPENEEKSGPDVVISQTFVSTGELYNMALQEAQGELLGYTVHNVDKPTVLVADEDMIRLEEMAAKLLPEGEFYSGDADTD